MKYLNKLNEAIKDSDLRIVRIDDCASQGVSNYNGIGEPAYVCHDLNGDAVPYGNYISVNATILIPIEK